MGPHANAYFLCIPRPLAVFRGSRVCRAATLVAIPACFIDCFLRGRARDSSSLSALRFSLFLPRLECGAVGSRHRPTSLSNANAERMQAEPSRPRPAGCPSSHQLRSPFWLHEFMIGFWILDSGPNFSDSGGGWRYCRYLPGAFLHLKRFAVRCQQQCLEQGGMKSKEGMKDWKFY